MTRLPLMTLCSVSLLVGAGLFAACAATGGDGGETKEGTTSATTTGGAGGTTSTGGAGGATSTGGAGGQGGSGGEAPECQQVEGEVLGMDELFLGEYDFAHQKSPTAWKKFGFDIDGLTTTDDFSAHCLPNNGASPSQAFADGDGGVDNSFGKNVLPVLLGVNSQLSEQANITINSGAFTLLWFFEKLGMTADVDPLVTKLYGGASLGGAPQWDGMDCWPVLEDSVADPLDILSAKVVFDKATLASDHWESNGVTDLTIPLNIMGYLAPLKVYQARMSAQLAPSHKGAALGIIGGVLDTEEFVEAVRDVAGNLNPSFCSGEPFDSMAAQIRQASDILVDGTQDPTKTCDGISVGLGFTLLQLTFGKVAKAGPPPADPCP